MYWNCRSFLNKSIEFFDFLINKHINIACLQETHLRTDDRLYIHPKYKLYRLDRTTDRQRGGGVAIVVDKDIDHTLLPFINTRILESIGIEISLANSSKIQIFSVYLPGGEDSRSINRYFISDLRKITSRHNNYFVCGDFNARHRMWNCSSNNTTGKLLFNEYMNGIYDLSILNPDTPTHFPDDPNRNPSCIDLALTNGHFQTTDLTCYSFESDHCAVVFEIFESRPSLSNCSRLIRAYNKTNWTEYKNIVHNSLNTNIPTITNTHEIDTLLNDFTAVLLNAQEMTVPLINPHTYEITVTPPNKQLMSLRNIFRREWQMNRQMRYYKTMINVLSKQISCGIQEIRNSNWGIKLQNLKDDDHRKSLWKIQKFLKNRNRQIPTLTHDSIKAITATEKAELLASQFELFHNNPLHNNDPVFTSHINETVNDYLASNNTEEPNFPSVGEITEQINSLKTSKAPGNDRIHNSLLKNLPRSAMKHLATILIACMTFCYFPNDWKCANVIPIKKPGKDPQLSTSYRPISLLSSISKILEKVITSRIHHHLELYNILPSAQYGFRKFMSTTHQLKRVTNQLKQNLRRKYTTAALMFDVEKAYDRVWTNGLIYKMIITNFPSYIIRIVASFVRHRSFQVIINNTKSSTKVIQYGLPQGAVMSPILYNIYTYDLPSPQNCMLALYADDSLLLSWSDNWPEIENNINNGVNEFHSFFERWKITLNPQKTEAFLVTRRRVRAVPSLPFVHNGNEVEWESEAKYLGMIIDKTLTFKQNTDYLLNKTQTAIRTLYPLIARRSKLNIENKLLIYKTAIRPIFTYASPVYIDMAKQHKKKLQIIQNKILRMILDAPMYTRTDDLHEEAGVETVENFVDRLNIKFVNSLQFI